MLWETLSREKTSWKVRSLCSLSLSGNMAMSTKKYGFWPVGYYKAQILSVFSTSYPSWIFLLNCGTNALKKMECLFLLVAQL